MVSRWVWLPQVRPGVESEDVWLSLAWPGAVVTCRVPSVESLAHADRSERSRRVTAWIMRPGRRLIHQAGGYSGLVDKEAFRTTGFALADRA